MLILDCVNRIKMLSHRGQAANTTDTITTNILIALDIAWQDISQLLPRQAYIQHSDVNGTNLPTVQGTDVYSLPTNPYQIQELINVRYVFMNVNYNMNKIESEREFFRQVYYAQPAQTRPYIYVPYGFDGSGNKQIRIFPVPDQVYTLIYSFYIDPTTVQINSTLLNSTVPFLPSYLQEALWKGGLYYFLKSFDDPHAAEAMADYAAARTRQDISEDADMDSDVQFRFETNKTRFVDPITGIRLI